MIAQADKPRRSRRNTSLGWGNVPLTPEQWQLVLDNKGLIVPMMVKCGLAGIDSMEFDEWFQDVGMAALSRAARAFDPSRGFKFSTYACRAILSAIGRERRARFRHSTRCVLFGYIGHEDMGVDKPGPAPDMLAGLEAEELREMIAKLPERMRHVIIGRFIEGKKLRELAAEIGLTVERIRQLQQTSLEMLRGWLSGSKRKRRCTA